MRKEGFEPPRPFGHKILSLALTHFFPYIPHFFRNYAHNYARCSHPALFHESFKALHCLGGAESRVVNVPLGRGKVGVPGQLRFTDLKNVLSKMGPAGKELASQFKALGIESLSTLRSALADANAKLNTLKKDIPLEIIAKQAEEAAKRISGLTESTQAHIRAMQMQQENAAILQGGDALKNFNLSVQLQKDFPSVADKQTQAYKDQKAALDQLNQLELEKSVNSQVASQLKFQDLQKNIDYLMTLRQTVQDNSDLQIAIDRTLHDDKLKQMQTVRYGTT
jgi:hypothetical protein